MNLLMNKFENVRKLNQNLKESLSFMKTNYKSMQLSTNRSLKKLDYSFRLNENTDRGILRDIKKR